MRQLAFLVPTYQKQATIEATLTEIEAAAAACGLDYEIVAIDDGSTDRSLELLKKREALNPRLRVFANGQNLGFAKTYFLAVDKAQAGSVMYISADNDIDRGTLMELLSHFGSAEVIIQSCKNRSERKQPRRLISEGFTAVMNWVTGLDLKYYNGFNIYPRAALLSIDVSETSFAFQAEIVRQVLRSHSFREIEIQCGFCDESSAALKPKNVLGVARFVLRTVGGKLSWMR
jgi:glycosyltransferase involved in cell wall biosynthesis